MENCRELLFCLCCGSSDLKLVLDLGDQPPANNYNVKEKYPLRLNACMQCGHAQLSHAVNPKILFKDYPYMSGVSETMREYYKNFAEVITQLYPGARSVLDIACNDGSQLDEFKKLGFVTTGIDPAENICDIASKKGHRIICDYFPEKKEEKLLQTYDVVIAQNVLAHVSDPFGFLHACNQVMNYNSVLIIQTSQANMIDNHQFDTIYHEHISFFNKRSFHKIFENAGFEIIDHTTRDVHGGSDLYILQKLKPISFLDYVEFSARSYIFKDKFKSVIEAHQRDKEVICFGAAAKMINLIRFTGIRPNYLIDETPTKRGKVIEGLFVDSINLLESRKKGCLIIPVWNFYEEIKAKVEKLYPGKFKFLKYIPEIII